MIKNRHKILLSLVLLLIIFSFGKAYAENYSLDSLNIEVYINKDASARIKEKRQSYMGEGTENYIVIDNLGNSEIIDFQVYENGEKYQYIDNWDISASRQEKAKKNSIITTNDGYELSWGIGEYGDHEYNLEYTVTNFVKELEDSQMIFWRFVNDQTNIPPKEVIVTISSDYEFNDVNERIWTFGYKGMIKFEDGKIIAWNEEALTSDDYLTILTQLPQGLFETQDILNQTFEEVRQEAFIGSSYDEGVFEEAYEEDYEDESSFAPSPINLISSIIPLIILGISSIFIGKAFKNSNKSPGKFKRKYKEEYYRDYPYENDFLDIYYIVYMMGIGDFENVLTGFILKWINEDRIKSVEEEVGWIFKKDQTNLKFLKTSSLHHPLENELFQMMLTAAGSNKILEENEFTKWAGKNTSKIEKWEKQVRENSIQKLEALGYLDISENKILFINFPKYELSEKGKQLEANIYKYINYLYDFSLLNEHRAINVKIWDNIMVWAGFLGLTDLVLKQFEKLYPNYRQETVYSGNTIFMTHHLARNISQAKSSASSSTSASSGMGGGSSMGGGGGSFGGGSGGGVR